MNIIVYQNRDLEFHSIQLGNYPTANFFRKCERCGLKVFCIIEGGVAGFISFADRAQKV